MRRMSRILRRNLIWVWMYQDRVDGVEQSDHGEALKWFRKGSRNREMRTCPVRIWAGCTGGDLEVEQSDEETVKWYRKSAEQGNMGTRRRIWAGCTKEGTRE